MFTYAHLKNEIPFVSEIVVVNLPGRVIAECITYTRQFALNNPPVEKGGYIQTDDSIVWDEQENQVLCIAGSPVDLNRIYTVALPLQILQGLDNIEPLLAYKNSLQPSDKSLTVLEDSGVGLKNIIVAYFAKQLFNDMIQSVGSFSEMDLDGDGVISREELIVAARKKFSEHDTLGGDYVSKLFVDNLFNVADLNNDGVFSKRELMELALSSLKKIKFADHCRITSRKRIRETMVSREEAREAIRELLVHMDAQTQDESLVESIISSLDENHDGLIDKNEIEDHLREYLRKSVKKVVI